MSVIDNKKITTVIKQVKGSLKESIDIKKTNQMEKNLKKRLTEGEDNLEPIVDTDIAIEKPGLDTDSVEDVKDEPQEFIDVIDVAEEDGTFTVGSPAQVQLAVGNKVKFTVGEEVFYAEVTAIDEETGKATIEPIEEGPEGLEGEPEVEETGEEMTTDADLDQLVKDKVPGEGEEEEAIIEEILNENYLDNRGYKGYNYNFDSGMNEDVIEEIEDPNAAPAVAEPNTAEAGPEGLENLDNTNPDMGGDVDMGGAGSAGIDMSGAPATDLGEPGAEPVQGTGIPGDATAAVDIDDEIEQIIKGTLMDEEQEEVNVLDELVQGLSEDELVRLDETDARMKENPLYKNASTKDAARTKLSTEEIKGNVKGATKGEVVPGVGKAKVNPAAKQTDVKSKKLNTEADDITSTVKDTKGTKTTPADITTKVKETKDASIDPGDKFTSKVKEESALKNKALLKLSEQVIHLQDDNKRLQFENYKLLKVNGLLTLLPELQQNTRTQLVEKFERCSNDSQVVALYKKVIGVVKESRKPSLNEIVQGQTKPIKYFTESKAHDQSTLKEMVDRTQNRPEENEAVNKEQARINNLMGLPGSEDSYFSWK